MVAGLLALVMSILLSACSEHKESGTETKGTATSESVPGDGVAHASSAPSAGLNIVTLDPDAEKMAGIKTSEVGQNCIDEYVRTTGEVLADANLVTHINSPVSGRVTDVLAQLGQRMEQGKPVLMIRSPDIEDAEANLLQQDAEIKADLKKDLLQIDSDIATAKAQRDLSQKTYARVQSLLEEKIASRADWEGAQTQYQKDSILLDALQKKRESTVLLSKDKLRLVTEPIKQRLHLMGVPDDEIERILRTRKLEAVVPVYAPETGIVCDRQVNVGELVDTQKNLITIGDFHKVWLKADVYEKDIAKLKHGQNIDLDVDSFPDEKFHGKLDYLADSVNPDTRTLTVRAEVNNLNDKLKPKMFARMNILVGRSCVLTVPSSAVQDAGSNKVVYVSKGGGKFEERNVDIGRSFNNYVEIKSGVRKGEVVAVSGTFTLRSKSVDDNTSG